MVEDPEMQQHLERQRLVLKQLRAESGLTQNALAEAIGRSVETWRSYEKGNSRISADRLPLVARALRVSTEELTSRLYPSGRPPDDDDIGLRESLVDLLGPDQGDEIERVLRDIAAETPAVRRSIIEFIADTVAGRKARAARH